MPGSSLGTEDSESKNAVLSIRDSSRETNMSVNNKDKINAVLKIPAEQLGSWEAAVWCSVVSPQRTLKAGLEG